MNNSSQTNNSNQIAEPNIASPTTKDSNAKNSNAGKPKDDWLMNDPLGWDDIEIEEDTELNEQPIEYNGLEDDLSMSTDLSMNEDKTIFPNNTLQTTSHSLEVHSNGLSSNSIDSNSIDSNSINSNSLNTKSTIPEVEEVKEIKFDGDTSRANPHFKPLLPVPIHKGETGRQLIMDTETTGLDALKGDRVIEVGIVELVNRKFTGEKLHVYINPQRGMDEEVIRIHGITDAFLADKPTFDKVAQKLYDFMEGAEVIAHNASFDISFLKMEFDKVGLTDFADKIKVTDSLYMAKQQYPGQKNTLDALVRRLNVGKMDRTFHGALLDSEILAEVYLTMTGGQVTLAIDEDTQSEGAGSHADFSHLASQVIAVKTDITHHLKWLASLIPKYPMLAQTQGITCFHKVKANEQSLPLIYHKPLNLTSFNKRQDPSSVSNSNANGKGLTEVGQPTLSNLVNGVFLNV